MKVKDVLKLACLFLNKQELLECAVFDTQLKEPDEQMTKDIDLLLRCLNLVVGEISCDYLPLSRVEITNVCDGKIEYADLSLTMLDLISVKTLNGKKVKFKSYPDYAEVENGVFEVTYTFIPDTLDIDDDICNFYGKVTERILAYGIAMEYSLLGSDYEEMQLWQKRFEDSLKIAVRKREEHKLPKRGWF